KLLNLASFVSSSGSSSDLSVSKNIDLTSDNSRCQPRRFSSGAAASASSSTCATTTRRSSTCSPMLKAALVISLLLCQCELSASDEHDHIVSFLLRGVGDPRILGIFGNSGTRD